MASVDDVLATMAEGDVTPTNIDEVLVIDGNTRQISIPGAELILGVESDTHSERKYFQCPRYVGNDLDLASCFIRVNYRNANGDVDAYLVDDVVARGNMITFSWELSRKVTQYMGQVKFLVCCNRPGGNGVTPKEWHTTLATGMVLVGLEPDSAAVETASEDVITALLAKVEAQSTNVEAVGASEVAKVTAEGTAQVNAVKTASEAAETAAVAEIEAKGVNVRESIPDDYTTLGNAVDALTRSRAGAIVCEASGSVVTVGDASDLPIQGLRVFGKTTQIKTSGAQLIDLGKRTDSKGVTSTFNNETLSVSGDGSTTYQYVRMDITDFVKNNPGRSLYFSYENIATATNLDGSVAQINLTLVGGTSRYTTILSKDLEHISFRIPDDVGNIESAALAIYSTNNTTPKANRVTLTRPMLNFGAETLPYEPYSAGVASPAPEYPQELVSPKPIVNVCGKNMIPPTVETISAQGMTSSPTQNGTVLLNGTATQEISRIVSQSFLLHPGKYTLSAWGLHKVDGNKDRMYLNAVDGSGTIVNYIMSGSPVTFEVAKAVVARAAIVFASGSSYSDEVVTLQLEAGSTSTGYEPYKGAQRLEVTQSIRAIPVASGGNYTDKNGQQWICDEVDLGRGVYVWRTDKVVFTEKDVLSTQTNTVRLRRDITSINQSKGWCNITDNYVYNATLDTVHYYITGSNCWVFVPIGYDLASKPVELVYQRAVPVETPLSETEIAAYRAMYSNYPNTLVLNDSGAHMVVKYAADTKLYIDNKIKEALQ